jgi:hypothetical protein
MTMGRELVMRVLWQFLPVLCLLLAALPGAAQIAEPELTGVFLVEGIYPGNALNITTVHVREVGEATYPSPEEMLAGVEAVFAGDPYFPYFNFQVAGIIGNFRLYLAEPGDFGACAIVDRRDGAVVFASGIVWMGFGQTLIPAASSHPWNWEAGVPAAPPGGFAILDNPFWSDESFTPQDYLLQLATDHIRQTDVMRSFGESAPYIVTGYLHTPSVGSTDPYVAVQVVIVSGHAGPPWGPDPISTTASSLDQVKALYR